MQTTHQPNGSSLGSGEALSAMPRGSAHFPKHPVSISSDILGSSILRMSVLLFAVKSRSVPNYTSYNQKIPTAQFSVGHMDSSEAAFDRVPKKA